MNNVDFLFSINLFLFFFRFHKINYSLKRLIIGVSGTVMVSFIAFLANFCVSLIIINI